MLELRLVQGGLLKKVIDAIKDLVTDANFDCSSTGFSLQAMDTSHVALVVLLLRSEGFEHFRCDRAISMGMNIANMAKMLKCASNDDIITVKADDGTDTITFMFESPSQDKISDIEMKLMDVDADHLGIPEVDYDAIVRMPALEFSSICSKLSTIGDNVTISVSKQGVTFSTKGDIGTGNITCLQNMFADKPEENTIVEMKQPVILTFALKYVTNFTKATSLSTQVTISLSMDMPMVVEYKVAEMGYIRFYLAPKVEEEEFEDNPRAETEPTPRGHTENPAEPEVEAIPDIIVPTNEENEAGIEEDIPDIIVPTNEENAAGDDENVEDTKEDLKIKVESEAMEQEFKTEMMEFEDEKKPKAEADSTKVEVMDVE